MCVVYLCLSWVWYFFFFKQKTAYEMRISDWSSDVCSSDLQQVGLALAIQCGGQPQAVAVAVSRRVGFAVDDSVSLRLRIVPMDGGQSALQVPAVRSEERRVGKACVSTCSSRWSPYH